MEKTIKDNDKKIGIQYSQIKFLTNFILSALLAAFWMLYKYQKKMEDKGKRNH